MDLPIFGVEVSLIPEPVPPVLVGRKNLKFFLDSGFCSLDFSLVAVPENGAGLFLLFGGSNRTRLFLLFGQSNCPELSLIGSGRNIDSKKDGSGSNFRGLITFSLVNTGELSYRIVWVSGISSKVRFTSSGSTFLGNFRSLTEEFSHRSDLRGDFLDGRDGIFLKIFAS
jgi:hypothetical protein